ncbi:phage integrase family protein [Yanghanlia caeni]|uniref:Phage integrase family protein n=1 Tax=Yanghanlia caeni TaxID=3064283 RepID=A0ABU1D9R2_9BURK|nr:phage integrase family protein [Alcaligenaceae bacterium LG-2]
MAQNNNVSRDQTRYTRLDFMALRYRLNGLPADTIKGRLFNDEAMEERKLFTAQDLVQWLDKLKRLLIDLALKENPFLAESLQHANRSGRWNNQLMSHLISLGERDYSYPKPEDQLIQWFKPRIASLLAEEGVTRINELMNLLAVRGRGWYRPIPRIGQGKAHAIERWLTEHIDHVGPIRWPREVALTNTVTLSPTAHPWVPLDRISAVAHELDGSKGRNRNQAFCLIQARNDLEAIQAYLYKYRDRPLTARAYRKELERFLLWCVCVRRIPMSSILTDDCEAYKDFISDVPDDWIGNKAPRTSNRWRPFAGKLSVESQRYAVQIIRSFFEWLVNVRYLGGNPWITVHDPIVTQRINELQIEKALPQDVWQKLAGENGILDSVCDAAQAEAEGSLNESNREPLNLGYFTNPRSPQAQAAQMRLVRAAILLIGSSGIRREEAVGATRDQLRPVDSHILSDNGGPRIWELNILGKRSKWRTVYLPARAVDALAAHWRDRGLNLYEPVHHAKQAPLLAPVIIPNTEAARRKHALNADLGSQPGFDSDALYKMMCNALARIAKQHSLKMPTEMREWLLITAPHALRHTFATGAAAKQMPVDVLQKLLGHTSVQTTSIYVQAEKARTVQEVQKILEG